MSPLVYPVHSLLPQMARPGPRGSRATPAERIRGLELVMRHYRFPGSPEFNEKVLTVTEVLRLEADEISGKKKV
jgi:hypothetical protein